MVAPVNSYTTGRLPLQSNRQAMRPNNTADPTSHKRTARLDTRGPGQPIVVFNPLARGCHELLRQGARLLEGVDDLLEELPALGRRDTATDTAYVAPALDGDEVRMLEAMGYDNVTADQLIDHTGMDPARAAVVLAGLELKGIVQMERGGYIRCPSASRRAGR